MEVNNFSHIDLIYLDDNQIYILHICHYYKDYIYLDIKCRNLDIIEALNNIQCKSLYHLENSLSRILNSFYSQNQSM